MQIPALHHVHLISSALTGVALICGTLACAGGTPEAEPPKAEASEDTPEQQAPDSKPSEEVVSDETEPEPDKPKGPSPDQVLLKEGTAFMIDHAASDMGKDVDERCEKSSKGDVAKKANCVSKAINAMEREGFTFDDDGGEWYFVRFAVIKGKKREYNRIAIDVGKPTGKKIVLTTRGTDKGSRAKGAAPSELVFIVEDEYSIVLEDPKRGKLVLEPKLGLFGSNE